MPAAGGAHHLGSNHPVGRVALFLDRVLARRRGKRGPAATRVVLGRGTEELGATPGAAVGPRLEHVVVLAAERRLGSLLTQDAELLGRQLPAPLLLGLLDLLHAPPSLERSGRYVLLPGYSGIQARPRLTTRLLRPPLDGALGSGARRRDSARRDGGPLSPRPRVG